MSEKLKKNKELVIAIFLVLLLLIGGSFAYFTLVLNGTKENVIKAGNLELTLDETTSNGISLSNAIPVSDINGLATEAYTFTLENKGTMGANYTIYLDDIAIDEGKTRMADKYVKYSLTKNGGEATTALLTTTGANPNRVLDTGTIAGSTTNTYTLRIWIDKDADNGAMGTVFNAQLRIEAEQSPQSATSTTTNSNIVVAYTYNSSTCVTGEEDTCEVNTCYSSEDADSCSAGTIVKYKVNDAETKYFHVLHDDGDTITMQQRENTIYNTAWYADAADNTQGPLTILPALETATSGWSNVNDQTYTMGTTNFNGTNAYTGCPEPSSEGANFSCDTNTYTLGQRTGKARMITIQETSTLGCTTTSKSCPNWMNNYLYQSTNYGGTVADNIQRTDASGNSVYNYGYWTMSANSSNSANAWNLNTYGYMDNIKISYTSCGARAVVVINK